MEFDGLHVVPSGNKCIDIVFATKTGIFCIFSVYIQCR